MGGEGGGGGGPSICWIQAQQRRCSERLWSRPEDTPAAWPSSSSARIPVNLASRCRTRAWARASCAAHCNAPCTPRTQPGRRRPYRPSRTFPCTCCGVSSRRSSSAVVGSRGGGGVAPCVEAFAVNDFQICTFFLLGRVVHCCGNKRRAPCSSANSVQHTPLAAEARFELPGIAMLRTCRSQRARCHSAAAAMMGRTPHRRQRPSLIALSKQAVGLFRLRFWNAFR